MNLGFYIEKTSNIHFKRYPKLVSPLTTFANFHPIIG
mgnify:CR=1 FL=1